MSWFRRRPTPEISILVPWRPDSRSRKRIWGWLKKHYETYLPEAEIVIGRDRKGWRKPFSKTAAVNDAARKARGHTFVILDADAYLPPDTIRECHRRIWEADDHGQNLWFVPYRRLFRLTENATQIILHEDPREPWIFSADPINRHWVLDTGGSHHGNHFGAMAQILPAGAFWTVGGMDERFRGWGGEDVSFVRAIDTMWGRHRTTDNQVLHLYHYRIGTDWRDRKWKGQDRARTNEGLASRYGKADKQVEAMDELIREWFQS